MNVTRIGNQDNRINFNGWIHLKKGDFGQRTTVKDREIFKKIANITKEQVRRRTKNFYDVDRVIYLKDGTKVSSLGQYHLEVTNKNPKTLGFYHWSEHKSNTRGTTLEKKFDQAKKNIDKLFANFKPRKRTAQMQQMIDEQRAKIYAAVAQSQITVARH